MILQSFFSRSDLLVAAYAIITIKANIILGNALYRIQLKLPKPLTM